MCRGAGTERGDQPVPLPEDPATVRTIESALALADAEMANAMEHIADPAVKAYTADPLRHYSPAQQARAEERILEDIEALPEKEYHSDDTN